MNTRTLHRLCLVLALLLAVSTIVPALAVTGEGETRWGFHVTLAPKWLDPGEAEAFNASFMVLYAVHDALVKPMPGGELRCHRSPSP